MVVQTVLVGSVVTFSTWSRPSIFKFQFFVPFKKASGVRVMSLVPYTYVDVFANHFDVLAAAGAHASAEALIMLKSSVHSCVCVC